MDWDLVTDADWLEMDNVTGLLEGVPTNDDVGDHVVNISVLDIHGGLDWTEFVLEVMNINNAPRIGDIGNMMATEDTMFQYTLRATDVDVGDSLIWALRSGPAWLNVDNDTLFGTPGNDAINLPLNSAINPGAVPSLFSTTFAPTGI